MKSYGSRKFILSLLAILGSSWLVWMKAIDGGVFATVVSTALVAYGASNVAQKATAKAPE